MQSALAQAKSMGENSAVSTNYAEINERLEEFIKYFVKESEAKFYSYHLVLEGELKRSGKFTQAFSEALAHGAGGTAGITGLVFGLPPSGTKVLFQAGKSIVEKIGDRIGNDIYAKEVRKLSDLIEFSQKSKATFRNALVEAGYDIFQSFEMQFMRVSIDESSSCAMRVLAKDAINRAVNYMKKNKSASISESVLLGESTRNELESLRPGFSVTYKNQLCKKTWSTGKLYSKVGLVRMENSKPLYFAKKESHTAKYGYRRLLNQEEWDALSKVYKLDNIAESKSGHFTDYEYVLDLKDMEVKCESIFKKINLDDKCLTESRIRELLEEVKEDILDEIKILKKRSHGYSEDGRLLENLEESVNSFSSEDHLRTMKEYFRETKEEIEKLIKQSSSAVVQQIENMSNNNMEQHKNTQAALERLQDGVEVVQNEHKESKQITGELVDGVKQVGVNVEKLLKQQRRRNKDPLWFNMKESVESFTGRQKQLDQLVGYAKSGMVFITGLSGVGKSELAIKYARIHYNKDSSVILINAKKRETIKQSFYRLHKKLGFETEDDSGTEKDIKFIAEEVYRHFSSNRSLFIFDDVEKYTTIKDVLPRGLPSDVNKPCVLVTAQNLEVQLRMTLPLGDFTEDESVDFIAKFYKGDAEINEMRKLAKELHNFPLALQQAVAYIAEENKKVKNVDPNKEFTIGDYLEEFDRETEELLRSEVFQQLGSDYDKTTFTALQMTLNKIRNQEDGQQASEILNTMAYCSPDNIPASFFLGVTNGDKRKLGAIIQLLKDYSVVSGEGLLNMHGLMQQVVRLELAKKMEGGPVAEEVVLRKALELLKKYMTDYPTMERYIPHITSVWNHASKYNALVDSFVVNYPGDSVPYTTYFNVIMESSPFTIVTKVLGKIEEKWPGRLDKVINLECSNGITPIYCSALSGDEQRVKLLMSKGSNIDVATKRKWRLLHFAAKYGYQETVQALVKRGININPQTEYNFTPLHLAVKREYLEIVNLLLSHGAKVEMKTNRGFTPLHFAVITGRTDIVETLLNNKAALTDKTRHRYSPLHLAAKHGHLEVLKLLLERGADAQDKTRLKFTPLHFAAEQGHLSVVQALLNKEGSVNAKDGKHFTPLHLAALKGHSEVVDMLLEHEAQINDVTTEGNTPLHFALENGHLKVVDILIANKAKLDMKNKQSKTALDLASESNFVEVRDHINELVTE